MSFLRRCRGFFAFVRAWMPLGFEVVLTCLSIRAAYILLTDQKYFDHYEVQYHWLVEHFTHEEWQLGLLAALAACLKASGLLFLGVRNDRLRDLAFVLREVGWGCSALFWGALGVTWSAGNPSSLGAWLGLAMSIFAVGSMLAGPVVPDGGPDGR